MSDQEDKEKLEKALHELELMVKAVLDNTPDRVLTVTRDKTIVFNNRMLPGMESKQMFGMTVAEYVPSEYAQIMNESIDKVFKKGEEQSFTIDIFGPDGNTIWYAVHMTAAKEGDETLAAIVTLTDVTKTKQYEQENEKLKKIIKEIKDGHIAIGGLTDSGGPTQSNGQTDDQSQQIQALQQQVQELTALNATMQKSPQDKGGFMQQLTNSGSGQLQQENQFLKQQIQKLTAQTLTQSEDMQRLREQLGQTQRTQDDSQRLKQQLQQLHDETASEINRQTQQIQSLRETNSQLEQRLKATDSERESSKGSLAQENEELQKKVKELNEELDAEKKKVDHAQDEEWKLLDLVEKAKEQTSNLNSEVEKDEEELTEDLKALQDLNRIVLDRIRNLEKGLKKDKKQTFILRGKDDKTD